MKRRTNILFCKTCVFRNLLFGSLNDVEFDLVNGTRKEFIYKKGGKIKREGEKFKSFLYLRKGLIKLYKTDRFGKDHILSINKPGDFVSLLHLFSNETYQYSIAALEETHVCEIDLSVVNHLIKTNGDFALEIIKRIGIIADEVITGRFNKSQLQIKGKVASILLFLSDQVYHDISFRMPVTRREIGELISMSTENVIRTLSEFKRDGIVAFNGKKVTILNHEKLVSISEKG